MLKEICQEPKNGLYNASDMRALIRFYLTLIRSGRYDRRINGLLVDIYQKLWEEPRARRYARRED